MRRRPEPVSKGAEHPERFRHRNNMSRTGTKVRPVLRASRPKGGGVRAPRPTGRKRRGDSILTTLSRQLLRIETIGVGIVLVSLLAIAALIMMADAPAPLRDLVRLLGLHSLTILGAVVAIGVLIWQRQPAVAASSPRLAAAALLLICVTAGGL